MRVLSASLLFLAQVIGFTAENRSLIPPIKVAFIGSHPGALKAFQMALNEENLKGGLGGRAFQVLTYDSIQAAKLKRDGAVAFAGFFSNREALRSPLPSFRLSFSIDREVTETVKFSRGRLQTRYAIQIVDRSDRTSIELGEMFKRKYELDGGTVHQTLYIKPGEKNFSNIVSELEAMEKKPDIIFSAVGAVQSDLLMQALSNLPMKVAVIGNASWQLSPKFSSLSNGYYPGYRSLNDAAYEAGHSLIAALKKGGSVESRILVSALRNLPNRLQNEIRIFALQRGKTTLYDGKESTILSTGRGGRIRWGSIFGVTALLSLLLFAFRHMRKQAALGDLAVQVAHDIRSPLTALSVVNEDLSELPESKRVLVQTAVTRIRDIADKLKPSEMEKAAVYPVAPMVENLLVEKRLQLKTKPSIQIDSAFAEDAPNFLAKIQPSEFKTILSNLINNAVEAIPDEGEILIGLKEMNGAIALEVMDSGRGISTEIQEKLFRKGATFGKEGGSGLGLFHAREKLAKWGGKISLESAIGRGTRVSIYLPLAAT